jgi:hypothetical protein
MLRLQYNELRYDNLSQWRCFVERMENCVHVFRVQKFNRPGRLFLQRQLSLCGGVAFVRMKVICKTVAGASAEVEVEPTDTLAELKVMIFDFLCSTFSQFSRPIARIEIAS